ncbi:hypothetical protein D3C85_1264230 [compost metagenome]
MAKHKDAQPAVSASHPSGYLRGCASAGPLSHSCFDAKSCSKYSVTARVRAEYWRSSHHGRSHAQPQSRHRLGRGAPGHRRSLARLIRSDQADETSANCTQLLREAVAAYARLTMRFDFPSAGMRPRCCPWSGSTTSICIPSPARLILDWTSVVLRSTSTAMG